MYCGALDLVDRVHLITFLCRMCGGLTALDHGPRDQGLELMMIYSLHYIKEASDMWRSLRALALTTLVFSSHE